MMKKLLAGLFAGCPVVEFVILNKDGSIRRSLRLTQADLGKHFPMKNGDYIIGYNVAVMKTVKAIKAEFRLESDNAARRFKEKCPALCVRSVATVGLPLAA